MTNEESVQDITGAELFHTAQSDYTELLYTLLHSKKIIASITGLIMMCSVLYFSAKPNLYTASIKIIIEKTDMNTPRSSQDMMMPSFRGEEDYYGTQIAILTGRKISQMVAEEIPKARQANVIAKRVRGTRIITLSVVYKDPELAATICNKYGAVFVRESSRENLFMSQQILSLIPDDLDVLTKGSETAKVADTMEQKLGSKFNRREFAESLSNVANDPIIQRLRQKRIELDAKVAELSQRYKSEHPVLKQAEEQLSYANTEIHERTNVILNNLKANLAGEINITNIRVLEEALPPQSPSSPKRVRGVLLHGLMGLIGSCGFVLFFEHANQKIRTEKDLYPTIRLPFLGYIPYAKNFMKRKRGVTEAKDAEEVSYLEGLRENSVLSDAVASVRTHLLFSMPYEKSRKIMLTSCIPNEGKSTVAALLALSLTTLGRNILLVDGDLRKPYLHSYLGLKNDKGLTDHLIGAISLDEAIRDVPGSTLKMITAGSVSPNPSELLSSESFRILLEKALERFDRVIIDVPPVLYIPDGLVVAKHVHSSVLVCGSGMIFKKIVKTVVEKFDSIGHSFIGVVINRADYEHEKYRYKYFSTYKNYYSKPVAPARFLSGWKIPIPDSLKEKLPVLGKFLK